MAYTVSYDYTAATDITDLNLSLDYIADPAADVRIYVGGSLLTYAADYTIDTITQYPYYTTFIVHFLNVIVAGSAVRIEKNEEWNQWIQFKFPQLEARIQALELKVGTATNVDSRLTVLETNLASAEADIVTQNGIISGHDSDITMAQGDIINLQNAVVDNTADIQDLQAFLGVEDAVAIDNNVTTPIVISELTTDGYAFTSVKVDYEIMRRIGTEYRSSVGTLYLVCKENGVWYTERGLQIIDLDGVSFSISTDPNRIGTISYTSDHMVGAGYLGYFKFRTTKFEV